MTKARASAAELVLGVVTLVLSFYIKGPVGDVMAGMAGVQIGIGLGRIRRNRR
jgi:hypothetical protein